MPSMMKTISIFFRVVLVATVCISSFAIANEKSCGVKSSSDKYIAVKRDVTVSSDVKYISTCDAKCRRDLQAILDTYRTKYNIPAMSMSMGFTSAMQQPLFDFYSGTVTREGKVPVTATNLFAVGSTTKTFVATILLQLEAEGRLNLDDNIGKWFPQKYLNWHSIKIRQLMNHTSGIYDYVDNENIQEVFKNPKRIWSMEELIQHAYDHKPNINFPAGTSWSYSNTNYQLVGRIIEKATGKSLKKNLEERIFKIVGLRNTLYNITTPAAKITNRVHGYSKDPLPFGDPDIVGINMSPAAAAGALITTSHDEVKFAQALFSGKLLPAKQFAAMTSFVCSDETCQKGSALLPGSNQAGYGLGMRAGYDVGFGRFLSHGGMIFGFNTTFFYLPKNHFIVAIFGNFVNPSSDDGYYVKLCSEIYNYFYPHPAGH